MKISRRTFGVGAVAMATAGLSFRARAAGGEVTVVGFGGSFQDAMREVYWKPFEAKTGIKVLEDTWNGAFGTIRAKASSGSVNWDVIQMPGDGLLLGDEEGLYEPLDWAALGGRDAFVSQGATDYGVGCEIGCIVLAYDTS
ncbi:MAG: ABC transporter substrate-binding protein, partial [Pseudomonadota bacterium]